MLRLQKTFILRAALAGALLLAGCKGPWVKEFKQDERAPNSASPTVPPVPNVNLNNSGTATIPVTLNDPDGQLDCRAAIGTRSSDITLVPATYMDVSGVSPNCVVTVRAAPGAVGTTTITLAANDGKNTSYASFDINVYGPPAISGTPVRTAVIGKPYAGFTVTGSGGLEPYTYGVASGSLPAGITVNSTTGAVSGTPSAGGRFSNIVLRTTDATGASSNLAAFDLYVANYTMDLTTEARDPLVTFSRASLATRVNASRQLELVARDGHRTDYDPATGIAIGLLIEEERQNLIRGAEIFDSTAWWTRTNATVTGNTIAAPDARMAGDTLGENTSTGSHGLSLPTGLSLANSALPYSFSVFVRAVNRNAVTLRINDGSATNAVMATCNLGSGTVSAATAAGNFTQPRSFVQAFPNGWYRCGVSGISGTTGTGPTQTLNVAINLNNGSGESYNGTGTAGVQLWGAQLEQGPKATSYIPSRNFARDSETLASTSSWASSYLSVATSYSGTAPDGSAVNLTLVDNEKSAFLYIPNPSYLEQAYTGIPNDSATYYVSVYVQKNAPRIIAFYAGLTGGTAVRKAIAVNTTTGVYTGASASASANGPTSAAVTDVTGTNYWRISFPITNNSSGNTALSVRLIPAYTDGLNGSSTNLNANTGPDNDQVGSAHFWGLQVEQSATLSPYIRTITNAVPRAADLAEVANLGVYANPSEGTLVTGAYLASAPAPGTTACASTFSDGSAANRFAQSFTPTAFSFDATKAGAAQTSSVVNVSTWGTLKAATAFQYNGLRAAVNGGLGTLGSPAEIPSVNRLRLGRGEGNVNFLNGHLQSITYWENRLPDALVPGVSQ